MGKNEMDENDVVINKSNLCMPVHAYINKYGDLISDAQLGAAVRRNHEEYERRMEETRPEREAEGRVLRALREQLRIPRTEMARQMDISPQTINNFEKGEPIRSRKVIKKFYDRILKDTKTQINNAFDDKK